MQLGSVARAMTFGERGGILFQNACRSCGTIFLDSDCSNRNWKSGFAKPFTPRRKEKIKREKSNIFASCEASWSGARRGYFCGNGFSHFTLHEVVPGRLLGGLHALHSKKLGGQRSGMWDGMAWFTNSVCQMYTRQLQARAVSPGGESKTKDYRRPARRRRRLDEICVERFPEYSRTLIQSWIMQGKVLVEGQPVLKAGSSIPETSDINIIAEVPKYVCRAGYKLEGALEHFACDVRGVVALDSGLSTGGFTDCLLQNGAARVYGVDVGYGQVSEKIRTDERVVVMERTNLRLLTALPELVDLVTLDLSFISILTVMPAVKAAMKPSASLITLIKPQFEAKRGQVGSGGIIRDPAVHSEVLERVTSGIQGHGFTLQGWIPSPLKGADGNIEFLALFHRKTIAIEPKEDSPALNNEVLGA